MKEKVILVTGGSRGIGAAIVSRFAKEGSRVYFTYHSSEDAAKALVGSLGKKAGVSYLRCDVRDRNTVEETVNKILEKEQRLDVLVNNAGIIRDNLFLTLSDEDWKEVLETNLGGVYTFCKAAAKTMIRMWRPTYSLSPMPSRMGRRTSLRIASLIESPGTLNRM